MILTTERFQLVAPCFLGEPFARAFRQRHQSVNVCVVSDQFHELDCTCLVYPRPMPVFSYPRACNYGIRNSPADIVAVGPIDSWWSQAALEAAMEVRDGEMVAFHVHRVPSFADLPAWKNDTNFPFLGGYVAAKASTWRMLRGFNEFLVGWGGDDLDLFNRASKLVDVLVPQDCPVWDLDHADDRGGTNWKRHGQANFDNMRRSGEARWHEMPQAADWGTACFS